MDINDNNAEERNEEALLELDRINSEEEKARLKDHETEYNPKFEKPATEKPGDLIPVSQDEQAKITSGGGLDQLEEFKGWKNLPEGAEKEERKTAWFRTYYNMTPQEYKESNFFQKWGAGWKNQKPSSTSIPAALGLGAIDFVGDVGSYIHPTIGAMDDWWDRKTKLNNPTLQKWRSFGNIVIPSMVGSGAVLNATKGGSLITQGTALLGIDVAVTGLSEDQTKSESITRSLIDTWPGQFGPNGRTPLPNALATHDHMSSANRKLIHMIESTPFSIVGNALGFLFSSGKPKLSWFKPLEKQAK